MGTDQLRDDYAENRPPEPFEPMALPPPAMSDEDIEKDLNPAFLITRPPLFPTLEVETHPVKVHCLIPHPRHSQILALRFDQRT